MAPILPLLLLVLQFCLALSIVHAQCGRRPLLLHATTTTRAPQFADEPAQGPGSILILLRDNNDNNNNESSVRLKRHHRHGSNRNDAQSLPSPRPRNNFLHLAPKVIVRHRRTVLPQGKRRQKRTGFPVPPVVPPLAFAPAAPPAPAFGPAQAPAQQQFFQQQPQAPAAQAEYGGSQQQAQAEQQPQEFFQEPEQQFEPGSESLAQQQSFQSAQQAPAQSSSGQAASAQSGQAAPPFFPPVPIAPPAPLPIAPYYEPQAPYEEFEPEQPEAFTEPLPETTLSITTTTERPAPPSTTTQSEEAKRCELLRYPLPECYTDESNMMCCNPELEDSMRDAVQVLIDSEHDFHRCNTQRIANMVQSMAEDKFNTSFEVITGIGDYASRSHFYHNYICKIERDNRFILAYATPRPEAETVAIDGETSVAAIAGAERPHAATDSKLHNRESVIHGRRRVVDEQADLLNFVFTFRRRLRRK